MIAHIIHNPARHDRLKNILQQSAEQNITYQLWPSYHLSDSAEFNCAMAHLQIMKFAKQYKFPMVLIMEDDVRFTNPGAYHYFLQNIPEDFDIYTAGVYGDVKLRDNGTLSRMSGTHCYIVNYRIYSRAITIWNDLLHIGGSCHFDEFLSGLKDVKIKMPDRMCALQQPGYSDIAAMEVDYNNEKFIKFPTF